MRLISPATALLLGLMGCVEYKYVSYEGVDVFFQEPANEVDILLVVDNSCSMQPYQTELGENFSAFLSFFIDVAVDYHIGVTTTTIEKPEPSGFQCSESVIENIPDAGRLVEDTYITPDTEDAESVFADIVSVGVCGQGFEQGLHAAWMALTDEDALDDNGDFLRDDAELSVIFVADEEDYSPLGVNDYINDFLAVKGDRERDVFNASALVVTDTSECSDDKIESGATKGTRYIDVAKQTDGVRGNICADDFEEIVTELSMNISRLQDTFYLSAMPDPGSISLSIDEDEWPCEDGGWTYTLLEGDDEEEVPAIVFDADSMPEPESQLTVRYNFGGGDPDDFCTGGDDGDDDDTGGR